MTTAYTAVNKKFKTADCDQGSHSVTEKKIQDFSRTFQEHHEKIFQDFFVAHECLNITYCQNKFESRGLQVICAFVRRKK